MYFDNKSDKERKRWEKMQKRGLTYNLGVNVLIWVGGYALFTVLYILCFHLGKYCYFQIQESRLEYRVKTAES